MKREHPERPVLERFMRDELTAAERREVVRHLLSGCEPCLEVTRRLWLQGDRMLSGRAHTTEEAEVLHPASYRDLFERLLAEGGRREERVAAEREQAPRLLAQLLREPRARRLAAIHEDGGKRFGTLPFCELLLERSREASASPDPQAAIELAEMAIAAADHLEATLCGATIVQDAKARAWARLGDARRVAADLDGAERAFHVAELLLGRGTEDGMERAELSCLEAALCADRGRFNEAAALLERSAELYRVAGERDLLGHTLCRQGEALGRAGETARAAALLEEGVGLLDELRDLRFAFDALQGLARLLLDAARGEEALAYVRRARALQVGDPPARARLRWLEGLAAGSLARMDQAEAALAEPRDRLLAAGVGQDAAGVLLDLAALHARQGRWDQVRGLAAELFPSLRVRELRQGAMAALLVLRRTVETERASLDLLGELARYVCVARRRRALPPWTP